MVDTLQRNLVKKNDDAILPYFDTKHLICEISNLFEEGSQNFLEIGMSKIISTRDCKKIFY